MTYGRQIGMLLLIGGLLAPGAAGASITPAERCAASQLTAVGKLASASLACHAKIPPLPFPPEPTDLPACLARATTTFEHFWPPEPTFAAALGGCTSTVTAAEVEAEVSSVVNTTADQLAGPEGALLTTPAARVCAAAKLKATGKAAKAQLGCAAKGAKQATVFSSACVEHAGAALTKAWGTAEGAGGCVTQGDNEALSINGLRGWGVAHLGGNLIAPSCGTFVTSWGGYGNGDGQFNFAGAVAVDGSGNVFVDDGAMRRIQKFDNTGKFLSKWGDAGSGDGQFEGPEGLRADGSGNVYVVDTFNERIQKFDNTGMFLLTLGWGVKDGATAFEICTSGCEAGLSGSGNGQFSKPADAALDASGNVFVADWGNLRIQKFDHTNTFLTAFGSPNNAQFKNPLGVAADGSGNVFVVEEHVIEKFTNTGTFQLAWGSPGSALGQFDFPMAVAVDGSGNVFVADFANERVQVFDNSGTLLTVWGSRGSGNGQFEGPQSIAVDGSGNVFVADLGNTRIEKFACPIPPPPCRGISQSCSANGQCCSNFCQGQALVCDCFTTGDDCRQGPQSCCSGACDAQTGLCL
jgi:hypothetical protein